MDVSKLSSEQLYELVQNFLPELEKQIRKEIQEQLDAEYDHKMQTETNLIQEKARIEINGIIEELEKDTLQKYKLQQKQGLQTESEFQEKLFKQAQRINEEAEIKYQEKFEIEREKLVKELLGDKVRMDSKQRTEERLKQEIQKQIKLEFDVELNKREKQLKLHFKKQIEQDKKNLIEDYELQWKNKMEIQQKELDKEKAEIARLKSLENIRLKKLTDERQQMKQQYNEQEQSYNETINKLQKQIQELLDEKERLAVLYEKNQQKENLLQKSKKIDTIREGTLEQTEKDFQKYLEQPRDEHNYEQEELFQQKLFFPEDIQSLNINQNGLSSARIHSPPLSPKVSPYKVALNQKLLMKPYDQICLENTNQFQNENIFDPLSPPNLLTLNRDELKNEFKPFKQQQKEDTQQDNQYQTYTKKYNLLTSSASKQNELENPPKVESSIVVNKTIPTIPRPYSDAPKIRNSEFSNQYQLMLQKYNHSTKKKDSRQNSVEKGSTDRIQLNQDKSQKYLKILEKTLSEKKNTKESWQAHHYNEMFKDSSDDDQKTREMKQLKRQIEDLQYRDNLSKDRCKAAEIYLQHDFIKKMAYFSHDHAKQIFDEVKQLLEFWDLNDTSYTERLRFIDQLELLFADTNEFLRKIQSQNEYLRIHYKYSKFITEKIRQRALLMIKLRTDNFSYKTSIKLYLNLRTIAQELQDLHYEYKKQNRSQYEWKDIAVSDLIKCDLWEIDYVKGLDMKKEIIEKIKRKML